MLKLNQEELITCSGTSPYIFSFDRLIFTKRFDSAISKTDFGLMYPNDFLFSLNEAISLNYYYSCSSKF
jgi:hypothetical protein